MSTITFDQISNFGDLIPAGNEFVTRAKKCELKTTKAKEDGTGGGKPFVSITLECIGGEFEGLEVSKSYWLSYKKTNNKIYAKGVTELFADMEALSKPLPKSFPFNVSGEDSYGRGTITNGGDLVKETAKRIAPSATPRIKVKSIAVRQQKQNAEGKWVDGFNADGAPMMRTEYIIVGTGANAGATATHLVGGFNPDEGATVTDDEDPLAGL